MTSTTTKVPVPHRGQHPHSNFATRRMNASTDSSAYGGGRVPSAACAAARPAAFAAGPSKPYRAFYCASVCHPAPKARATATVASRRWVWICTAARSAASELRWASVTSR